MKQKPYLISVLTFNMLNLGKLLTLNIVKLNTINTSTCLISCLQIFINEIKDDTLVQPMTHLYINLFKWTFKIIIE